MCHAFKTIQDRYRNLPVFAALKKFSGRGAIFNAASLDIEPEEFAIIANRSRRLQPFLTGDGCRCVKCGAHGNVAIKHTRHVLDGKHHDVFALTDRMFRLMTVDHILPKSWGGTNYYTNYEPMCLSCNSSRGNKVTEIEAATIVDNIDNHLACSPEGLNRFLTLLTEWPLLHNSVIQRLRACQDGHITKGVLCTISTNIGNVPEMLAVPINL